MSNFWSIWQATIAVAILVRLAISRALWAYLLQRRSPLARSKMAQLRAVS